jgi:hypothetical protein
MLQLNIPFVQDKFCRLALNIKVRPEAEHFTILNLSTIAQLAATLVLSLATFVSKVEFSPTEAHSPTHIFQTSLKRATYRHPSLFCHGVGNEC